MDYREMRRLAGDPVKVRALAAGLSSEAAGLAGAPKSFLERLAAYDGSEPLSTRECEWLFGLRDQASVSAAFGGYSLRDVIRRAYEARLDLLDEEAEIWIAELYAKGPEVRLPLSQRRRLALLLRQLGLIDGWVDLR